MLSLVPAELLLSEAGDYTFTTNDSGVAEAEGVFLSLEIVRFNNLIKIIMTTLDELSRAIKGLQAMS